MDAYLEHHVLLQHPVSGNYLVYYDHTGEGALMHGLNRHAHWYIEPYTGDTFRLRNVEHGIYLGIENEEVRGYAGRHRHNQWRVVRVGTGTEEGWVTLLATNANHLFGVSPFDDYGSVHADHRPDRRHHEVEFRVHDLGPASTSPGTQPVSPSLGMQPLPPPLGTQPVPPPSDDDNGGFPTWAIVLIIVAVITLITALVFLL